jgi:transcription-repair coupling factor (superfamily II helicase)
MRDLELRGAGDILSTRQTGHVAAIGLHLYTQMLSKAVRDLKGESGKKDDLTPTISESSVLIDLPLPAYLPTDWIPEITLRLQIYRRIGGLNTVDEVNAMRDELRDRFGQLPAAVDGLLYQMHVKLLAQDANASAILHRDGIAEIRLPYLVELDRPGLERDLGGNVRVTRTAVELSMVEGWQPRLLDVLVYLATNVKLAVGI